MRRFRLLLIAICSFLAVAGAGSFKKSLAMLLCGVLSLNTPTCHAFLSHPVHASLPPVTAQPAPEAKANPLIADIPRIRKPELELPADLRIVRQVPFKSGKREIIFVSASTGAEQVYLTSLPDAGRFELFGIEVRNLGQVDLSPILLGKNIQLNPAEIQTLLKEFKIYFKDNSLSKVILANGTKAEFTLSHAVIKSSKGKELERIPLSNLKSSVDEKLTDQSIAAVKSLRKTTSKEPVILQSGSLAKAESSPCQGETKNYLQSSAGQMSQLGNQLTSGNSKYPILVGAALMYSDSSLKGSVVSNELADTVCKAPVQCNEEVISGGSEIRTDLFQVPQGSNRKVSLEYEFYEVPDRLEMDFDGKRVTAIGPTSGRSTQTFEFPGDAKYVGVKLIGNQDIKTTKWWYKVSCAELGIDQWWATAGQRDPLVVTWTVDVPSDGNYQLDIDIERINSWDLTSSARVTVDSASSTTFRFDGVAELGNLKKGIHRLKIDGFEVPQNPVIEQITFQLSNSSSKDEELVALFIADHPERGDMASVYQELARKYAPILYFDNGKMDTVAPKLRSNTRGAERFSTTFNAKAIWQKGQETRKTQMQKGHSGDFIDLSSYATKVNKTESIIYAAVLNNPREAEIAINYYFHYPRSNWGEHGGFNTHEGDWEGITVFLDAKGHHPKRVAFAQHVEIGILGVLDSTLQGDGGQIAPWNEALEREGDRPKVYVGLGGHASYPYSDITGWLIPDPKIPRTFYEFHRGNLSTQKEVQVEYLPRLGNSQAPDWLRYPGYWGRQNIGGRGGNSGPRGPAFLDTFEKATTRRSYSGRGERWLDPWGWSSSFDTKP